MKDLVIMHVQAAGLIGVTEQEKLEIEQRYSEAVLTYMNGDILEVERCLNNALRCLKNIPAYPSGNPTIDAIVERWEAANMVGVRAAFAGLGNTGGAHFEIEFWMK